MNSRRIKLETPIILEQILKFTFFRTRCSSQDVGTKNRMVSNQEIHFLFSGATYILNVNIQAQRNCIYYILVSGCVYGGRGCVIFFENRRKWLCVFLTIIALTVATCVYLQFSRVFARKCLPTSFRTKTTYDHDNNKLN